MARERTSGRSTSRLLCERTALMLSNSVWPTVTTFCGGFALRWDMHRQSAAALRLRFEQQPGSYAAARDSSRPLEEQVIDVLSLPLRRRREVEEDILMDWLSTIKFFQDNVRSNYMRKKICKAFTLLEFQMGEAIVREGELADAFYVVCSGTVQVTINGLAPSWGGVLGASSGAAVGASFGELGLAQEGVRRTGNTSRSTTACD
jgi:hypothetical protein